MAILDTFAMQAIFDAFEDNYETSLESLFERAIETDSHGFIRWVLCTGGIELDMVAWADYIHEHAGTPTLKLFYELDFNFDLDKLATFGKLEMLEFMYEETEELPGMDGYNGALKNSHLDVVDWLKEVAVDKLFEA